jgi:lysophospholipase L1-like esterase
MDTEPDRHPDLGSQRRAVVAPARSTAAGRAGAVLGPLCLGLALLAAIELGLRAFGWEAPVTGGGDPYLNLTALFHPAERPDGVAVMRRAGEAVEFLAEKPPNGFRVFVLGESSVHGFPYGPAYAFPAFLGRRLSVAFPDLIVEVVNCGVEGIASWHVARIAEEVARYAPDVVLVYTGHNDFIIPGPESIRPALRLLARVRVYQLAARVGTAWRRRRHGPIDVRELSNANQPYGAAHERALGTSTLSAAERAWIEARLQSNLRAIIRTARAAGAAPVVASLGQNFRDWIPGAWRHRAGLGSEGRARWKSLVDEGERRRRNGDCSGALAAYGRAKRIDGRPAALHFARARCLERLGRLGAARAGYRKASDLDEIPCGIPTALNRMIRRVSEEEGARFADVAGGLARGRPAALVGNDLFVDYVHPNLAGNQRIAALLARTLLAFGLPSSAPAIDAGYRDPAPAALLRAHPELVRQEHVSRVVLFLMLNRAAAAYREADTASRAFPDLAGAVDQIRRDLRRRVRSPAAGDTK